MDWYTIEWEKAFEEMHRKHRIRPKYNMSFRYPWQREYLEELQAIPLKLSPLQTPELHR